MRDVDFNEWYPEFEIKSKRRRIKYVLQKLTDFKNIEFTDFVFLPGDPLKKEMVDGSKEMKALSSKLVCVAKNPQNFSPRAHSSPQHIVADRVR